MPHWKLQYAIRLIDFSLIRESDMEKNEKQSGKT